MEMIPDDKLGGVKSSWARKLL